MNFQFQNLHGTEKLKQALVASIQIKRKIAEPLADGFQIPDLLAIYAAYPLAKRTFDDRQDIVTEFLDLTPEESVEVLDHVTAETGEPRDSVETVALQSFRVASRVYSLVDYNIREAKGIYLDIRMIGGMSGNVAA
jgi:hypothetical protein